MTESMQVFLNTHPPHEGNKKAGFFKSQKYKKLLPKPLIELWKTQGFGFYGKRCFAIIDPDKWQKTLDRWILTPPDQTRRIPIMLTVTGGLIYYRKLKSGEEDFAIIDPSTKQTELLGYSANSFFSDILTDKQVLQDLAPLSLILHSEESEGALQKGEVYCVDQTMFAMQMLKVSRENALAMHKRLRDAVVEKPVSKPVKDGSIADSMPDEYRTMFEQHDEETSGIHGLYLSRYIDRSRLLALSKDGIYQLLFWRNDYRTGEVSTVRIYDGGYDLSEIDNGDMIIELDIELNDNSLGSDANDEVLHIRPSSNRNILFPECELDSVANSIGGNGTLGEGRDYFLKVTLDDIVSDNDFEEFEAPPIKELPVALASLVNYKPVVTKIIDIRTDENSSFWVTLDKGTDDGLRHNMGLMSPANAEHELKGWVWGVDPKNCGLGLSEEVENPDNKRIKPEIGDVLVTSK